MEEGRPGCPSTSSTNMDSGAAAGRGREADGGLTVERGSSTGTGTVDCATFMGATGVDPVLNVVVNVSAGVIVGDCSCGGGGKAGEVKTARDKPGTKEGSTDSGVRSLFLSSCC